MVERDGKQKPIYVYHVFEGNKRFVDKLDKLSKELKEKRQQIETELTEALSKLLQSKDSGIGFFTRLEASIKGVKVVTLKTNHRHEIVESILGLYAEYRD